MNAEFDIQKYVIDFKKLVEDVMKKKKKTVPKTLFFINSLEDSSAVPHQRDCHASSSGSEDIGSESGR